MTQYYVQLTEDQALDIASGYVPNAIKAKVTLLLECDEEDRRRAERDTMREKIKTKRAKKDADTPTD